MKSVEEFVKEFEEKLPKMLKERYEEDAAYARGFKDPDNPSFVPIGNPEKMREWSKKEIEGFREMLDSGLLDIIKDLK